MLTAALLGAFHGINPAMGWLFAVFLAAQRRSRAELLRSLFPIALGHGLSVAMVVGVVALARSTLPVQPVRYASALIVLGFGIYRLVRWYRHVGWNSMRLNHWDLVLWSFLGATAHGSGLMLTPLILGTAGAGGTIAVVVIHTLVMLAVMAIVAVVVHDRGLLNALRRYWVNFDLLWAGGLILAGVLLFLAAAGHTHAHT